MTVTTVTPAPKDHQKTVARQDVTMTPEQAEAFGRELDALKERVIADLGERDATYIRRIIKAQRALEVGGRALLFGGIFPPFWLAGTAMLGLSKILDNMEIGHNVMHGQYDWMGDPAISSRGFEWDTACPADQWRHSHNYMHHTYTNIVGMDRDIGYGILRMSEDQKWRPYFLGNPIYAFLLMVLFQYGVALHELETERIRAGEITLADKREVLEGIWRKTKRQTLKDYVAFPLLAGPVRAVRVRRQPDRQPDAQRVVVHDHLLRPLPRGRPGVLHRGDQGRDARHVVLPPDPRLGKPDRRQAVSHPVRQPVVPDRAPPVPRHPGAPPRRDRGRGAGDLRALRHPVQHGSAAAAVRHRGPQDRQAGAAWLAKDIGAGQR